MKGDDSADPGSATVSLSDDDPAATAPPDGDFPFVARGHYAMGPEFARGGGGRLLRARDLRLDRVVAVKEPIAFSTRIERRFFREAVLTARLQHPSIVPIHEVGRWQTGEPFYAMKLVSGRSLREAVAETTTIEQRVALLPNVLAVADAIAYAHSQGVIHRDLKPSNVMVGAFGETQVIDWGLAKDLRARDDELDEAPLGNALETGGVRGTPATMAPEQATGGLVDERTDVYGIGALLYEVLAGGPPYLGETAVTVIERVAREPPPALADRAPGAPRELIAIAEHAMARDPARRYPSAHELAEDLRRFSNGQLVQAHRYSVWFRVRRFAKRHRAVLAALGVSLGLAGGMVVAQARAARAAVCDGAERELGRVWGSDKRLAIARALVAGGKPWAGETAERVSEQIDRYGREWVAMHRDACEATSVRHEQSEALLDRRMACLGERLSEVDALARLLSQPSDTLVASAPKAAYAMTPLRGCADGKALLAPVPLPVNPTTRSEVDQIRAALANVKAMNDLGRYAEAEPVVAGLVERARASHYSPVEAEALEAQGDSLDYIAEFPRAAEAYRQSILAAERGLDRARVASAMINLVWELGVDQGLHERAHEYAAHAAAMLSGLGGNVELESNLASNDSTVFRDEGRSEDAERRIREAIEKRRIAFGPMHPRYAMAVGNLAAIVSDQGRAAEALALSQEALAINARTLGEHHPDYALSLQSVASSLNLLGRRSEARPLAERAVVVLSEALGPEHARVASAEWSLGLIETSLGAYADAERHLRHAIAAAESLRGADHVYVAEYICALADALVKASRNAEAVALYDRALAILLKDPNEQVTAEVQAGRGLAFIGLSRPVDALAMLEPSLQWAEKGHGSARELASTRLQVARALCMSGGDRDRARRLGALAVATFRVDPASQDDLREATAWLEGLGILTN